MEILERLSGCAVAVGVSGTGINTNNTANYNSIFVRGLPGHAYPRLGRLLDATKRRKITGLHRWQPTPLSLGCAHTLAQKQRPRGTGGHDGRRRESDRDKKKEKRSERASSGSE